MAAMIPFVASAFGGSSIISTAFQGMGTLLSLQGAKTDTANAEAAARANQMQLNYAAGQEEAASQRRAELARRKADLMISRGIAVAAASGAGVTGIDRILQGIAAEGETQASNELYQGSEKANELRYRGQIGVQQAKAQGQATMLNAYASAANSLSKPVASIFDRFAPSAPPTDVSLSAASGLGN